MAFQLPCPRILYGNTDFVIQNDANFRDHTRIESSRLKHMFMTYICKYWKDIINHNWTDTLRVKHKCEEVHELTKGRSSCNIINLVSKIYLMKTDYPTELPIFHVCILDHCLRKHNVRDPLHTSGTLIMDITECYICEMTGLEHFCQDYCNTYVGYSEGDTCLITGLQVNHHLIDFGPDFLIVPADQFIKNTETQSKLPFMTKDSVSVNMTEVLNLIGESDILDESTVIELDETAFKQQYLMSALLYVSKLLNEKKLHEILCENYDIKDDIGPGISRYLLTRYSNKRLVSVFELYILRLRARKRKYDFPFFQLSKEQKKRIIYGYALNLVKLWYIIRTKTKHGQKSPKDFNFEDFMQTAFVLLEEGISIRMEKGNKFTVVKVLEPDILLRNLPVNGRFEKRQDNIIYNKDESTYNNNNQKTLSINKRLQKSMKVCDGSKKNEKRKKAARYNMMKDNIECALHNALVNEGVPENELMLSSINFEDMKEENFTPLLNSLNVQSVANKKGKILSDSQSFESVIIQDEQ